MCIDCRCACGCVFAACGNFGAAACCRVPASERVACSGRSRECTVGAVVGTYDLSGCEIYTTGEPCDMCLCACMWANISKIYYGCTIEDNERIGFRDKKFANIFEGREKLKDYLVCVCRDECLELFQKYNEIGGENY